MRTALLAAGADPGHAPAVAVAAAATSLPLDPTTPGGPSFAPPAAPPPAAAPPSAAPPMPPPSIAPPIAPPIAPRPVAGPTHQLPPPDPTSGPLPEPTPARRRRRWPLVVVVLAVAAIAAALVTLGDGDGAAGALPAAGARSFDPQGDNGTENEDLVGLAIDGDPTTAWRSEQYRDAEGMAGKDGVGIVIELGAVARIDHVDVRSADAGWTAQVYVTDGDAPTDLAGWGAAVASVDGAAAGTTRLATDGTRGDQVLVWFTRVPASGTISVADVTVHGR
jgi:hypothetical protein